MKELMSIMGNLMKFGSVLMAIIGCLFIVFLLFSGYQILGVVVKIPGMDVNLGKPTETVIDSPTIKSNQAQPTAKMMVVTATPQVSQQQNIVPTQVIEIHPTSASLTCQNALRNIQSYTPGQIISGPATLHPFDGCNEMASQLGFACIGYWGINIKSDQSITIPESVTLFNGKVLKPPFGTVSTYESDKQQENTQSFWLANCK